jgi:hypothetical protein
VAFVILFLAVAPHFGPRAHAAEPPPASHEAAVLDRIFANWKARHDRVRSLHFTIDNRAFYKKGASDFSSEDPRRLDRDQLFRQFGVQIWIEGGDRMCIVNTPTFKVPQAKLTDTHRVVLRTVTVGQTTWNYLAPRPFETGGAPRDWCAPHGTVWRSTGVDPPLVGPVVRPLLLTFRPQSPFISWRKEEARLVDENSLVDGGRYIKVQRVVESTRAVPFRRTEACWVSPARNDDVVHWRIQTDDRTIDGSVKYTRDKTCGWVPSEWTVGTRGAEFSEYKVVKYELNEPIDPSVFSQPFPAGTPVEDRSGSGRALKIRYYVVQPDGSERAITHQNFSRLAKVP